MSPSRKTAVSDAGQKLKQTKRTHLGAFCLFYRLRHESLTIIVHFVQILESVLDPDSTVLCPRKWAQNMSPSRKTAVSDAGQKLKQTKRTHLGAFCLFYRFPPISGPGFLLATTSLFEYFFGDRVF